jgi:hypothetical protein
MSQRFPSSIAKANGLKYSIGLWIILLKYRIGGIAGGSITNYCMMMIFLVSVFIKKSINSDTIYS